jgi:hypothetical protein
VAEEEEKPRFLFFSVMKMRWFRFSLFFDRVDPRRVLFFLACATSLADRKQKRRWAIKSSHQGAS